MTNILKTLNAKIHAETSLASLVIYNDTFPDDKTEGVIAIHDPSARKVEEYIDGTCVYQLNVSYTSRFRNPKTARSTLEGILECLDGQKLSDSEDGLKVRVSASANVQFIGTDDAGNSLYTCGLVTEYTKIN